MSKAYIGTIELTSILDEFIDEMTAGNISLKSKIGFCKVFVGDNEGQIPHFHITSKTTDFECCIRIYESKYFIHGSKDGILNSKQCKLLDKWLSENSKIINFDNLTNWQVICSFWQAQGNPLTNIPKNKNFKKPDYNFISR